MLLQRLVAFERPVGPDVEAIPPFFQLKAVRWGLAIDENGREMSDRLLDLADASDKLTKRGIKAPVPYTTKTSAVSPMLGADEIQYVLGWAGEDSKPGWVADCHAAFVGIVDAWAAADPDSETARAVARFYRSGGPLRIRQPDKWTPKDVIVLFVGDDQRWATADPSLQRFWAGEVARRKAGGKTKQKAPDSAPAGRVGICLVCGQTASLVDSLPQQISLRLVPKATQNAALVSANKSIHRYDFGEKLSTVPICITCAQTSVANLEYLLGAPSHTIVGGNGDSRLTWWTIGRAFDINRILSEPSPARIAELVWRLRTGDGPVRVGTFDVDRYCAVTVAGNVSRVMILDWVDMPLAAVEKNIAAWFDDHETTSAEPARSPYLPLVRFELAAGQWQRQPRSRAGKYENFSKKDTRPEDLRRQLLRAALKGTPLAPSLFSHILTRIRADRHIDAPRVALLRLGLQRRGYRTPNGRTLMPGLDPDNHDPAYVAGRIFAHLETIQYYASRPGAGGDEKLNTTFADRYLAGAIVNPRIALVQGRQLVPAWLRKIRRTDPRTAGWLDTRLAELCALLDGAAGTGRHATRDRSGGQRRGIHLGEDHNDLTEHVLCQARGSAEESTSARITTAVVASGSAP